MEGKWIFTEAKRTEEPMMVCFRKEVLVDRVCDRCTIQISADSRYFLYINSDMVDCGPAKMPAGLRCYDELDITPYIKQGNNEIFVKVLCYPKDSLKVLGFSSGPISVITEGVGGLLIHELDTNYGLSTDESWMCAKIDGYGFVKNKFAGYVGFSEHIDYERVQASLDNNMKNAVVVMDSANSNPYGLASFWQLVKRPIPQMYMEKKDTFKLMRQYDNTYEYDAQVYVFAFPAIKVSGKQGGFAKLTYAESYGRFEETGYVKGVRNNPDRQEIIGEVDYITLQEGETIYIPFYPRAFRFVKVEVSEDVEVEEFFYYETGYPLDVQAEFKADDEVYEKIWDVSLRTLKLCMYETYVDCPYYEQMQYMMDTYLEAIYTMSVSDDSRLVKKAINDFAYSQLPNGLLPCNAPSSFVQVIPGFAIYWLLLLDAYFMYEDDVEFVKGHLGTVDRIIDFFTRHINEDGLLGDTGFWQFFDWVDGWERGVPVQKGVNILYNMLFVLGLRTAAKLNLSVGRLSTHNEYLALANSLSYQIIKHSFDKETGLFKNSPNDEKPVSVHAQVFAVVAQVVMCEDNKRALMRTTVENAGKLKPMSYAMRFFLCRALEETDMYDEVYKTFRIWDAYKELLELDLTTWPEDFVTQRSDCHGWSALPLSEFVRCYLGVRPIEYGFKKVGIYIYDSPFEKYSGTAVAKGKEIFVDIDNVTGNVALRIPKGLDYELKDFRKNVQSPKYLISTY